MGKLNEKRPQLSDQQIAKVAQGLKQFFLAHAQSGKFVSMPSQVADDLWHEFILYTKAYADFCNKAFGKFMHHTPAIVLGKQHQNNEGLRRTWWYACKQERINPRTPTRLPILFALDSQLGIPDGFIYHPQCDNLRKASDGGAVYCGGDFSSSSADGVASGFGDDSSFSSDFSSGCSGDSGGSGDGGGGCGGGGD
ncbi:MAG: glycine-rich domain-containing protein [Burkholderiaceae bacterium]